MFSKLQRCYTFYGVDIYCIPMIPNHFNFYYFNKLQYKMVKKKKKSLSWKELLNNLKLKVIQSYLTLCDPVDCIVHGILQARILEWVAFPFSRGSSQSRDWTQISHIIGRFFTSWTTGEAHWVIWETHNEEMLKFGSVTEKTCLNRHHSDGRVKHSPKF